MVDGTSTRVVSMHVYPHTISDCPRRSTPATLMPPRAIKALEKDIGELDGEYNILSDLLAHGEQEDFSKESHDYIDHIEI